MGSVARCCSCPETVPGSSVYLGLRGRSLPQDTADREGELPSLPWLHQHGVDTLGPGAFRRHGMAEAGTEDDGEVRAHVPEGPGERVPREMGHRLIRDD